MLPPAALPASSVQSVNTLSSHRRYITSFGQLNRARNADSFFVVFCVGF
jgi:hypothetical protein